MDEDSKLNVFKKKKADGLTADNVDNTAPVNKIIEDMEQSNHQAFMYLNSNRRPRYQCRDIFMKKHYLLPGHQLAAFPDDWDGDLSPDYFQSFQYKSTKPQMIGPMANILKQDPLSEYLQIKQKWRTELRCQKQSCASYKIPLLEKYKEHNDEVVSCPKVLVDMARHLENDPDPYFDSSYNWYYAGQGNMQLIWINNQEYLMCSEFHLCYIFEFNRVELTYSREAATVFDCGDGNNICESIWSSLDIIALRTKHKIFVLKIVTLDNNIQIKQIKLSESKMPYTSISFDQYHKNILYVTQLNNILKIVNLDRLTARTVELKNSVKSLVDNWNTVIGNERTYYTHVASNSVTLYDKRINKSVQRWKNVHKISDETWCNKIGAAKYSPGRPYLYFATNHHLFLMDMRYQTNMKLKPLQRWTHGMQCWPTYISICNFEHDKELVCLASQWCEDTCVVPNYLQTESGQPEFKGITIPYRLPTILETLDEARLQALCIDVYKSIENRLVAAISGNLLLKKDDKYAVLSQNSLGDVTAHLLYPEQLEMFIQDDATEALHEWCQDYEVEKKDYVMTSVDDIKELWEHLQDVPEGEINKRYENEETSFDEKEIFDTFESGELDDGLLDVWLDEGGAGGEAGADDASDTSRSLNIMKDVD